MANIVLGDAVVQEEVLALYQDCGWSSAQKPFQLLNALRASHSLATARAEGKLVGIANAISDGHLVVYFPHLLVHSQFRGQGIGSQLMRAVMAPYSGFHQQMLTADGDAELFYVKLGFERAGRTQPMWIYAGDEH